MDKPETINPSDAGWHDPRRWKIPSPLIVCWTVLVAAAAAATWWSIGQPWQTGLPILLLVLFSELLLAICVLAARARGMFWELRGLTGSVLARLNALHKLDETLQDANRSLRTLRQQTAAINDTGITGIGGLLGTLQQDVLDLRRQTTAINDTGITGIGGLLGQVQQDVLDLRRQAAAINDTGITGIGGLLGQVQRDVLDLRNQAAAIRTDVASIKTGGQPTVMQPVDRQLLLDATSRVGDDVAALKRHLQESVARIRYDVEDGKLLLVDLLGGPETRAGRLAVNDGDESDER